MLRFQHTECIGRDEERTPSPGTLYCPHTLFTREGTRIGRRHQAGITYYVHCTLRIEIRYGRVFTNNLQSFSNGDRVNLPTLDNRQQSHPTIGGG